MASEVNIADLAKQATVEVMATADTAWRAMELAQVHREGFTLSSPVYQQRRLAFLPPRLLANGLPFTVTYTPSPTSFREDAAIQIDGPLVKDEEIHDQEVTMRVNSLGGDRRKVTISATDSVDDAPRVAIFPTIIDQTPGDGFGRDTAIDSPTRAIPTVNVTAAGIKKVFKTPGVHPEEVVKSIQALGQFAAIAEAFLQRDSDGRVVIPSNRELQQRARRRLLK